MIVLAVLLLLLVAAVVLLVAVTGSTQTVDLVWGATGYAWAPTALGIFLLGAAVMLTADAAVGLLLRGSRRSGQRRRERRHERRVNPRRTAAEAGPVTTGGSASVTAVTEPVPVAVPVSRSSSGRRTGSGPWPGPVTGPALNSGAELERVTGPVPIARERGRERAAAQRRGSTAQHSEDRDDVSAPPVPAGHGRRSARRSTP